MTSGDSAVRAGIIIAALFAGASPAVAQANGDPGSAILGISKAQTNATARAKSNENPMGQKIETPVPDKNAPQNMARKDHHD